MLCLTAFEYELSDMCVDGRVEVLSKDDFSMTLSSLDNIGMILLVDRLSRTMSSLVDIFFKSVAFGPHVLQNQSTNFDTFFSNILITSGSSP